MNVRTAKEPTRTATPVPEAPPRRRRVLVVDDSRLQRKILMTHLRRVDVEVLEADSGERALEILGAQRIDMVVSDWMMPGGMTGLELCTELRARPDLGAAPGEPDGYVYFVLSTSKGEKEEIAQGLSVGADDFVTKPVDGAELAARIKAGERILIMQEQLRETNRKVREAYAEVRALHAATERDLEQARKLQHALVRRWQEDFGAAEVTLSLRSSGHVGGDLVGFFKNCDGCVSVYGIDVSGHGIASALMSARLAGSLSITDRKQNVALTARAGDGCVGSSIAEVAVRMNEATLEEVDTETYFTLLYSELDLRSGRLSFVQAGHPPPLILRADGRVEFAGEGGLPVGLIPGASWEAVAVTLRPGDRFLAYSDGVTECEDPAGEMLEGPGLAEIVGRHRGLAGRPFLEAIMHSLEAHAGTAEFTDDVSMALIEYRGPEGLPA